MITRVEIDNVLAFQHLEIELRALTLLSGTSSSGKSSLLHVLAMLRQSYSAETLPEALLLNGDEVDLGTGRDILHSEPHELSPDEPVAMRIAIQTSEKPVVWIADYEMAADVLMSRLESAEEPDLGIFGSGFQYLRADRIIPSVTYPKSHEKVSVERSLGARGEHAANYLRVHGESAIRAQSAGHAAAISSSLLDQTNAWLNELSPGTLLSVEDVPGTDFVRLSFSRAGPEVRTESQRATNVGFGLTYALPVIVACLMAEPGSLLLIENPEAHLHPNGQAILGSLCAAAAAGGAQVIVETHSDHVLNAVRLCIKRQELPADSAIIHFFTRQSEVLQPTLETMEVSSDGTIPQWPKGFFDQWDRALDELLG